METTTSSNLHRRDREATLATLISSFEVSPISRLEGKLLGHGGFGDVWRVTDPEKPEHDIAVKVLKNSTEQDALREIGNLIKLQHPCIVGLMGWSRGPDNVYEIRLTLAARGALSDYLKRDEDDAPVRFWNSTVKAIFICDIVLGMRYVHLRGIIHQDLKPANILVDENWRARVSGFGLSWCQSTDGFPSVHVKNELYAAPEQLPTSSYDEKVDVFSFGFILYEIVGGIPHPPMNRKGELPALIQGFDGLMKRLIGRCWSLDPSDRPSFREIFSEFQDHNFAILPGVDTKAISQSVCEVLQAESRLFGQRI
jgi:serine/threonine protein kinase